MFDPVGLARASVYQYIRRRELLAAPSDPPAELMAPKAAFVCIKKFGHLRGCMGTIKPTKANLGEEIIHNAVAAATRDTRFSPCVEGELELLEFSVDVLELPEPVRNIEELDPSTYGVIVRAGERKGLLLPDIEGVDTVEEQVSIARQKGGIKPDERIDVERFTVCRYPESSE